MTSEREIEAAAEAVEHLEMCISTALSNKKWVKSLAKAALEAAEKIRGEGHLLKLHKTAEILWNAEQAESYIQTGKTVIPLWKDLSTRMKEAYIKDFAHFMTVYNKQES